MFCKFCGGAIDESTRFCPTCGRPLSEMADASPPTTNSGSRLRSSASTDGKLIAAVAELVIGAIVVLYALVTILSDMSGQRGGYRYAFPLTLHEITTIMCLILGAILLFVGYAQWKTRNEK